MMGFYVAVALLATLTTGSDGAAHSQLGVLGVVWGTTVGLAAAHWFAMVLAARVVHDPDLHHTPMEMLFSQLVMAVFLALVATAVVIVLEDDLERFGARLAAAAFLAGLVGLEIRASGGRRSRAVAVGLGALAAGVAVATIKWWFSK